MKKNFKKLSSLALSLLLVFSLSLSAFAADISAQQAKEIALGDAGYKEADVAYIRAGVDYENGVKEYDVEFLVKNADAYLEYDYEVRAADGKILSKDRDVEKLNPDVVLSGDIGKEAALEAAYAAFGFSAEDVKLLKAEKDRDDGVVYYEVEFIKNYDCKYSCDVIAASGKVVDKEQDISRNFFDKVELFFEALFAQLFSGR
ncbi:MAG: PepSY domain-containing protein [Clostridia bacterium]|nr:PepSY domain-containing protein [Clostridia bacterium]